MFGSHQHPRLYLLPLVQSSCCSFRPSSVSGDNPSCVLGGNSRRWRESVRRPHQMHPGMLHSVIAAASLCCLKLKPAIRNVQQLLLREGIVTICFKLDTVPIADKQPATCPHCASQFINQSVLEIHLQRCPTTEEERNAGRGRGQGRGRSTGQVGENSVRNNNEVSRVEAASLLLKPSHL